MPPNGAAWANGVPNADRPNTPSSTRLAVVPADAPPLTNAGAGVDIDRAARRAFVQDRELPLTTQLFDLLTYFLARRGEAISFDDLAAEVWAYPNGGGDHHFLHTAVYRLRRILSAAGIEGLIDGIRGFGYRISVDPPVSTAITVEVEVESAIAVFDPADPELRLTMVNDAAVQLTGYSVEALTNLQQATTKLWSASERVLIDAAVAEALQNGSAETHGRRLICADGSTISVNIALSRLGLPNRDPLCLAEITPD